MDISQTPVSQMQLSAELRNIILERNLLTTKTRMKVLSALEDTPHRPEDLKKINLRSKAIHEILTSEASYLCHLELMMKYFMEPIKRNNYISNEDYLVIFGNIETIYHVNGELLNELKCNQENIAAAFLKLAPFLKLYSVYAFDYERALHRLNVLQKKSSVLSDFIESQENRPEVSTKLISLLITPIQRVPRYCLLLKEVIAHTLTTHPDYAVLQDSFQQVEFAAKHINSLIQEQENMQTMLSLQRSFCNGKPLIISPGRKFVKAGKLMKVSHKGRKARPRYFVLLSDMLLYCKLLNHDPWVPNSITCTCVLPLKKCCVQWVMGKTIFKVSCLNENFVLYSPSREESESWVDAISEAVKKFNLHRQTLRKGSSSKRPLRGQDICSLWQNDEIPSLQLGRKRSCPEERENVGESSKDCSNHGFHRANKPIEPSPHKIRKAAATSVLKESTNAVVSPDSLFPMRNELARLSKPIQDLGDTTPKGNTSKVDLQECSSESKYPDLLSTFQSHSLEEEVGGGKEAKEKDDAVGSRAGWNHSATSRRDIQGCRGSRWHHRCYHAVRSLSVNLHNSFRRQMDRLSSHHEANLSE